MRSTLLGEPVLWTEKVLPVDESEPFYFDHPLDHIPATLQLFGLLDLIRDTAEPRLGYERGTRLRLCVDFPMFCELGAEVRLGCHEIASGPSRVWRIRAEQDGCEVCAGELELVSEPGTPGLGTVPCWQDMPDSDTAVPIPAHRVHRLDAANVMIGSPEPSTAGSLQVPVISPRPGHSLRHPEHSERGPEELIEAARQLSVFLEHLAFEGRGEMQMILYSVEVDLPCGIPRVPLAVSATKTERRGRRVAYDFSIVAPWCGDIIGNFFITGWSVSKAAYHRMRSISAAG